MSEPTDVVYQRQGERELLARVYQPDGPGPFPTLVDVHGGAWHIGDRRQNAVIHVALAAAGILVLALDFRQSQDAPYPASILDINLGVRWAKANARRFNGTDEVGGLGSSSGGHQILLTALRPRDERYTQLSLSDHPDLDARLSFVLACWPIAHPLESYRRARELNLDGVAAYEAYWPSEIAMSEGDPHLILERREAEELSPLLVLQGTADDVVPVEMQERFVASYRAAGGQIELVRFQGMPHTFVQRQPEHPESQRAIETMIRFVKQRTPLVTAAGDKPRHNMVYTRGTDAGAEHPRLRDAVAEHTVAVVAVTVNTGIAVAHPDDTAARGTAAVNAFAAVALADHPKPRRAPAGYAGVAAAGAKNAFACSWSSTISDTLADNSNPVGSPPTSRASDSNAICQRVVELTAPPYARADSTESDDTATVLG